MKKTRARVIVSGMVQGVCFRYETQRQARLLGLAGWVMNRHNGAVEAVFEGEDPAVESMIDWCRKGPAGAIVDDIRVERGVFTGEFREFRVEFE